MTQGNKNPNKNGSQTMVQDTVNPADNKPEPAGGAALGSVADVDAKLKESKPAEKQPPVEETPVQKEEKPTKSKEKAKPMTAMEQVLAQHLERQKTNS